MDAEEIVRHLRKICAEHRYELSHGRPRVDRDDVIAEIETLVSNYEDIRDNPQDYPMRVPA